MIPPVTDYDRGYLAGVAHGREIGYETGYTDGEKLAKADAYLAGHNDGYDDADSYSATMRAVSIAVVAVCAAALIVTALLAVVI